MQRSIWKEWTQKEIELLKKIWPTHSNYEAHVAFKEAGFNRPITSLENKASRMRIVKKPETVRLAREKSQNPFDYTDVMDKLDWLPTFNTFENITQKVITICCDTHVPLIDKDMIEKMCVMSKQFQSDTCLIVGDFMDQSLFSQFLNYVESEVKTWTFELEVASTLLKQLLKTFKRVYVTKGNHDMRILRLAFGRIGMKHIFKWMDAYDAKRVIVSEYPFCHVHSGEKLWRCTHAKNYSQHYAVAVPKRMAEKHECEVINAGGHLTGQGFSPSGRMIIGLGLMGDPSKFEYIHMSDTTHPKWNPAFVILRNGFPFVFSKHGTDWGYWLKG